MGIPKPYFEMFDAEVIASHVHSFMAAKKLAQAMGKEESIYVTTEGPNGTVYMCPATYLDSVNVCWFFLWKLCAWNFFNVFFCRLNKRLNKRFLKSKKEKPSVLLTCVLPELQFPTENTDSACTSFKLLRTSTKKSPTKRYVPMFTFWPIFSQSNIWHIASGPFLRNKSFEIRSRYQDVIREAVGKLEPIFKVHPEGRDGTTRTFSSQKNNQASIFFFLLLIAYFLAVTLTIRHSQKASFLLKFTEVLKFHHINCSRKFIETFSNGLVVYTFYLNTNDQEKISKFLGKTKKAACFLTNIL